MITISVDVKKTLARLKRFGPEGRAALRVFMKKNGRSLISSSGAVPGLVQITPPFSKGTRGLAAKKQGEAKIAADISRVYGSPGKLYELIERKNSGAAAGFWRHVQKRDWQAANEIAQAVAGVRLREFDDGAEHRRRRNPRTGRVMGGKKPSLYVAQLSRGRKSPPSWIGSYIAQKQKLVGLLAGAVVNSGEAMLGQLRGVPAWVRRHSSNSGQVSFTENAGGITVAVANLSPRTGSDLQRRFNSIAMYRLVAMRRELPHVARSLEKKLQPGL